MLLTKKQPTKQPQLLNTPSVDLSYLESLAVVEQPIIPQSLGRVEYQGSSWPAICLQNITLNPGEIVKVIGRYNITLLVIQENHIADR
jgi:membrane protein implicated in regulation of membrane protease activity